MARPEDNRRPSTVAQSYIRIVGCVLGRFIVAIATELIARFCQNSEREQGSIV